MIIIFIHRWLRPNSEMQDRVRRAMGRLNRLLHIEVAEVVLERSGPGGSLFTARLHLAAAGQEYCAVGRERTRVGAIDQVLAKLSSQILHSHGGLLLAEQTSGQRRR